MKQFARQLSNDPVRIVRSNLAAPVITYLIDKAIWRLEAPFSCPHGGSNITVPRGFEFDLASIPRAFWWLVSPFDLSIAAPLLHDFLYRYAGDPPGGSVSPPRTYSRRQADLVFRDIMREEGVSWWRRVAAYRAVRWFGGNAWGAGP